jgi:hypothetical protein
MTVWCISCREKMAATQRQDGHPMFTCFTCGYERIVRSYQVITCGSCECSGVIDGEYDYLCQECRMAIT